MNNDTLNKQYNLRNEFALNNENLISIANIVKETQIPIRIIRYIIYWNIIRKPIRLCIGNRYSNGHIKKGTEGFFHKTYIFPALDCYMVLRQVFKLRSAIIRNIISLHDADIIALHNKLKTFLNTYHQNQTPNYLNLQNEFITELQKPIEGGVK